MKITELELNLAQDKKNIDLFLLAIKEKNELVLGEVLTDKEYLKSSLKTYLMDNEVVQEVKTMLEPKLSKYIKQEFPFFELKFENSKLLVKIGNFYKNKNLCEIDVLTQEVMQSETRIDDLLNLEQNNYYYETKVNDLLILSNQDQLNNKTKEELLIKIKTKKEELAKLPIKKGFLGKVIDDDSKAELEKLISKLQEEADSIVTVKEEDKKDVETLKKDIYMDEILAKNELDIITNQFGSMEDFVKKLMNLPEEYKEFLEEGNK